MQGGASLPSFCGTKRFGKAVRLWRFPPRIRHKLVLPAVQSTQSPVTENVSAAQAAGTLIMPM
jgi:hypothetical protein